MPDSTGGLGCLNGKLPLSLDGNTSIGKKFVLTRDCHLTLTSRQLNSAGESGPKLFNKVL